MIMLREHLEAATERPASVYVPEPYVTSILITHQLETRGVMLIFRALVFKQILGLRTFVSFEEIELANCDILEIRYDQGLADMKENIRAVPAP